MCVYVSAYIKESLVLVLKTVNPLIPIVKALNLINYEFDPLRWVKNKCYGQMGRSNPSGSDLYLVLFQQVYFKPNLGKQISIQKRCFYSLFCDQDTNIVI